MSYLRRNSTQSLRKNRQNLNLGKNIKRNLYKILGIKPDASQNEIEMAFYNLKVKYHPAVEKEVDTQNEKEFAKIEEAYKILSNPDKRKEYNESLSQSVSAEAKQPSFTKAQNVLTLGTVDQSVSTAII